MRVGDFGGESEVVLTGGVGTATLTSPGRPTGVGVSIAVIGDASSLLSPFPSFSSSVEFSLSDSPGVSGTPLLIGLRRTAAAPPPWLLL